MPHMAVMQLFSTRHIIMYQLDVRESITHTEKSNKCNPSVAYT